MPLNRLIQKMKGKNYKSKIKILLLHSSSICVHITKHVSSENGGGTKQSFANNSHQIKNKDVTDSCWIYHNFSKSSLIIFADTSVKYTMN
jgi:hypothetical protein